MIRVYENGFSSPIIWLYLGNDRDGSEKLTFVSHDQQSEFPRAFFPSYSENVVIEMSNGDQTSANEKEIAIQYIGSLAKKIVEKNDFPKACLGHLIVNPNQSEDLIISVFKDEDWGNVWDVSFKSMAYTGVMIGRKEHLTERDEISRIAEQVGCNFLRAQISPSFLSSMPGDKFDGERRAVTLLGTASGWAKHSGTKFGK